MTQPFPHNAMIQSAGEGQASFLVDEALVVSMSNGEGITLTLKLSPAEARVFAEALTGFADRAENSAGTPEALLADCVGTA